MNEKFTRGPWKRAYSAIIGPETDSDGDPVIIAVPYGCNRTNRPQRLDCYSVPPQEKAQANACLIAAAPDLYEALHMLVNGDDTPNATGSRALAWEKADDALAKARGEA